MVQSSGGGGIAFKLNGGMDGGGMAEVARTTSGENDELKHGFSVFFGYIMSIHLKSWAKCSHTNI